MSMICEKHLTDCSPLLVFFFSRRSSSRQSFRLSAAEAPADKVSDFQQTALFQYLLLLLETVLYCAVYAYKVHVIGRSKC
jgi:hypothetical protein